MSEEKRRWYTESFGRDYLDLYAHRDASEAARQIDFMEDALGPPPGARVLDLCCGSGRHSLELARRGYSVTGIDLSEELLAVAERERADAGLSASFARCDMREVVQEEAFDVVVNFFTSFGYFESDEENARVLDAIARSLVPGGKWLMDYLNRDQVVANLVPRDERREKNAHVVQQRRFDPLRGRVEKTITLRRSGEKPKVFRESVRAYTYPELERMVLQARLAVDAVFGDTDGRPFTVDAPRLILAGRRPLMATTSTSES